MVPHANELQKKFADKGLRIIGVTSESSEDTEPWIENKGVEYAYAYDRSGLGQALGIRGIPHGVLVDPYGQIVWKGHPTQLSEATIQAATADALPLPMWEWPASAAELKAAVQSGKVQAILKAAAALDAPEFENVGKLMRTKVTNSMARLDALLEDLDVLAAIDLASDLESKFEGLPEADEVGKQIQEIADQERLQAALEHQKQMVAMMESVPSTQEEAEQWSVARAKQVVADAERIAALYPDLAPARQAAAVIEYFNQLSDYLTNQE